SSKNFILSISISTGTDFITCLITIPYTVVFELLTYKLVYDLACKSYMFLITSTVPFSAYIMVAIALDRYFCICHPFLHAFTIPRAKALIFCMGIPAITFGIITGMSYGTYFYDEIEYVDINVTDVTKLPAELEELNLTENKLIYYDTCVHTKVYFSDSFLNFYKKVHALNFLVAYVIVAILYIMIYKSIFTRRANKARRKKNNLYPVSGTKLKTQPAEETQMTVIQNADNDSPKMINNQARKDAKCARKITLTARNDPTAFVKAGSRVVTIPEVQEDERTNLLPSSDEVGQTDTTNVTKISAAEEDVRAGHNLQENINTNISPNKRALSEDPTNRNDKSQNGYVKGTAERSNLESDSEGTKKNDEDTNNVNVYNGTAPEEKPLLPQPVPTPVQPSLVPPNTLSLKPNAISHQCTETKLAASKKHATGKHVTTDGQTNSIKRKRPSTVRDRNLMANIKTAFMLFIVTLVFIVAFLPALLMANELIPLNLIVFYSYFIYNVANPFIYAFMNQTFREDLTKIVSVCKK
uniref:G-protein coupled receptors family 1 profile domain-containing protein n=1 Tax=Biomphalaria glabrata TaxID=6526 RepID=A0A2C9LL03_BIOGL